jgi:hypothetical protein
LFDLGFSLENLRATTSPTRFTDEECVLHGLDVTYLYRHLVQTYAMPNILIAQILVYITRISSLERIPGITPRPSDIRLLIGDNWPPKPQIWSQGLGRAREIMAELGPTATAETCQVRAPELADALQIVLGTDTFDAVNWRWVIDSLEAYFEAGQHH